MGAGNGLVVARSNHRTASAGSRTQEIAIRSRRGDWFVISMIVAFSIGASRASWMLPSRAVTSATCRYASRHGSFAPPGAVRAGAGRRSQATTRVPSSVRACRSTIQGSPHALRLDRLVERDAIAARASVSPHVAQSPRDRGHPRSRGAAQRDHGGIPRRRAACARPTATRALDARLERCEGFEAGLSPAGNQPLQIRSPRASRAPV